jgi:hypothetical protein
MGIKGGIKGTDLFQGRFRNKILRIPRYAANGVAELEMGRDSRRDKVLCLAVKYWLRILQKDKGELIRGCYVWQISNLKFGS